MMTVVRKSGSMSSASRRRPDLAHLSGRTSVTAEPLGGSESGMFSFAASAAIGGRVGRRLNGYARHSLEGQ